MDFNDNSPAGGGKNRSNHNAIDREPVKTQDELREEWLKERLAAAGAVAKAYRVGVEEAKELVRAMGLYKKFHSNNKSFTAYADALLARMPGLELFAVPEDEPGKQVYMNWDAATERWERVEPKKLRDLVTLMVKLDRDAAAGRSFVEQSRAAWAEFELGVSARSGTAVVDDIDRADSGMIIAADGQAISIDPEAEGLGQPCRQRQDRPMRGRFAANCPDDDVDMKEWEDLLWVWMGGLFNRAELSEEEVREREAEVRARIKWLAKVFGSALLPNADEQGFFFMLGRGQNGKSLFLRVMKEVFGNYAVGLDVENYIEKKFSGGEDRLSNRSLLGKRLAIFSDAGDSRAPMNVGRIKQLTGDGDIPMRGHHEHYFDAPVQVTLIGQGNYAPRLPDPTNSLKRRLQIIRWDYIIPDEQIDKTLFNRLKKNLEAPFKWLLNGLVMYAEEGLDPPASVQFESDKALVRGTTYVKRWFRECLDECEASESVTAKQAHEHFLVYGVAMYEWFKWNKPQTEGSAVPELKASDVIPPVEQRLGPFKEQLDTFTEVDKLDGEGVDRILGYKIKPELIGIQPEVDGEQRTLDTSAPVVKPAESGGEPPAEQEEDIPW